MLKKSKVIAVLSVCVMMFGVVQPAFAWGNRTGSQTGDAVAYGAGAGTIAAGVAAAALIFFTGGIAAPVVIGAAAVAGTAGAAGGAYYGYNVEEKTLLKDAGVVVGAGVGGGAVAAATPIVAPIIAGATAAEVGTGAAVGGSAVGGTLQAVNDNKDTIRQSVVNAVREAPAKIVSSAAKGAGSTVGVLGVAYGGSKLLSKDITDLIPQN